MSFALVIVSATSSGAIDLGAEQSLIALKFGWSGGGSAEISNATGVSREIDLQAGTSLGVGFDFPTGRFLAIGLAVDIWNMGEEPGQDANRDFRGLGGVELGMQLKGLVSSGNGRFALRPGIGVGGFQSHYEILALRATLEVQYSLTKGLGAGLEGGVWFAPIGSGERWDVDAGPLGFLRLQILLAPGKPGIRN